MKKQKGKTPNKEKESSLRSDHSIVGDSQNVRGDVINVSNVGSGAAVAAGRGASASVGRTPEFAELLKELEKWRVNLEEKIDADLALGKEDKEDVKAQVNKVEKEIIKGDVADPNRLEKLLNVIGVMAPDIFEVAIATLVNPLSGIGLVVKKIGEKAKIESQTGS